MDYKLIIFDVDGTLVETKSGATFRKTADDWQWLPGRLERLQALYGQGIKLAIASNQGGVAFGYLAAEAMQQEIYKVGEAINCAFYGICYFHPDGKLAPWRFDSADRKPKPGMLKRAMQTLTISPLDTLMVGDRPEDEQAAEAAGVAFMWADEFFTS